eukprot:m51a1_g12078 hypothetical protein (144) ;mRNA; f:2285-3027
MEAEEVPLVQMAPTTPVALKERKKKKHPKGADSTSSVLTSQAPPAAAAAAVDQPGAGAAAEWRSDPKEQFRGVAMMIAERQDAVDRVRESARSIEPREYPEHRCLAYVPPRLPSLEVDPDQDDNAADVEYYDASSAGCCRCCC